MPRTAIVFVIGALSLAGVPLFAGFASKEEVLGGVWAGGFAVPFFMLLTAVFTLLIAEHQSETAHS